MFGAEVGGEASLGLALGPCSPSLSLIWRWPCQQWKIALDLGFDLSNKPTAEVCERSNKDLISEE